MSLGGLLAQAALLRQRLHNKPCHRCGQSYDHKAHSRCPHCTGKDASYVRQVQADREARTASNRNLGFVFLLAALALLLLLMLLVG